MSAQRHVVWINGLPLLLHAHMTATEENINTVRAEHGKPALTAHDEINGVEVIWMRGMVTGSVEQKFPERKRP